MTVLPEQMPILMKKVRIVLLSMTFLSLAITGLFSQSDTLYICEPGESVRLNAQPGYAGYRWTPYETLDNATVSNPIASPEETTTYYLEAITTEIAGQNLIANPDFSKGNNDFTSDYRYVVSVINTQGVYTVGPNPFPLNPMYFSACKDHTDGTGNMMIIDGAPVANQKVWCQTIDVLPGLDYAFSVWIATIFNPYPAILQFQINGEQIGEPFDATRDVCNWRQFYEIWNAGDATQAEICIINQNTSPDGNDFALDDFSFFQVGGIVRDTFTVVVEDSPVTEVDTAACPGGQIQYDGNIIPADTSVLLAYGSSRGCDSLVRINVGVIDGIFENGMPVELAAPADATLNVTEPVLVEIGDNASKPLSYQWIPSDGVSCPTCPVTEVFPGLTTTYTIVATDDRGCRTSTKWTAVVNFKGNFYIPNAFSPNGDGVNDELSVFPGKGVTGIRSFRIFDRWGSLLFEAKDCPPGNGNCAWDGTSRGREATEGVYLYSLAVDYADGTSETVSGEVALLR